MCGRLAGLGRREGLEMFVAGGGGEPEVDSGLAKAGAEKVKGVCGGMGGRRGKSKTNGGGAKIQ